MATWITHLRIAERLFAGLRDLSPVEFVMGNMAPDSGVPNDDWTAFVPDTECSHWRKIGADGIKRIHVEEYAEKYFSPETRQTYDKAQFSFYLGYLTHLYADIYWAYSARAQDEAFLKAFPEIDKGERARLLKRDWHDLDFLYLLENGEFWAFRLYKNAKGFQNQYLDFFARNAFDRRREYIVQNYLAGKDGVRREYPYFDKFQMETFVTESAEKMIQTLENEYHIKAPINAGKS